IASTALSVAEALDRMTDDYEVIVVNDGSRDRTGEVVEELSAQHPNIRCVTHTVNRGYGDALRTGLDAGTKDLLFLTDGDGQFDPGELANLLPLAESVDLVIGYRAPRRYQWERLLYAWVWRLAVSELFG